MGNAESSSDLTSLSVNTETKQVYNDWTMAAGELDGLPVTVFSASHPTSSEKQPYLLRALQASRVYRHPGLLRYIAGGAGVGGGGTVVVVTEEAVPLDCFGDMSPLAVTAGLASLLKTLVFLHDTAGVSHNNLSSGSVFVTPAGDWKLWGLEYSCSFSDLTPQHLSSIAPYCHAASIPPGGEATPQHYPGRGAGVPPLVGGEQHLHARDVYAFSALVAALVERCPRVADVPGASSWLAVVHRDGLHSDWTARPRCSALLDEHVLFRHHFLQLHSNLTTLMVMDEQQRDAFLGGIVSSLRQYPETVVASSLSSALLARTVLLVPGAAQAILPHVLTPKAGGEPTKGCIHDTGGEGDEAVPIGGLCAPTGGVSGGGLFSPVVFQEHIVPHILQLYSLHDLPVREILLVFLPAYVHLLPIKELKEELLPEILLGVQDRHSSLVAATLHALAVLVPVLGADCVVGGRRLPVFTATVPKAAPSLPAVQSSGPQIQSPVAISSGNSPNDWNEGLSINNSAGDLIERSSPDGGEDDLSDGGQMADKEDRQVDKSTDVSQQPSSSPVKTNALNSSVKKSSNSSRNYRKKSEESKGSSSIYKHGVVGFSEIFGGDPLYGDNDKLEQEGKTDESDSINTTFDSMENKIDGDLQTIQTSVDQLVEHDSEDSRDGGDWSDWDDVTESRVRKGENIASSVEMSKGDSILYADKRNLDEYGFKRKTDACDEFSNEAHQSKLILNTGNKNKTEYSEAKQVKNDGNKVVRTESRVSDEVKVPEARQINRNVDPTKGLGSEYDILTIEVKKKRDTELDFFADLAPNLNHNKYDLESMLEAATAREAEYSDGNQRSAQSQGVGDTNLNSRSRQDKVGKSLLENDESMNSVSIPVKHKQPSVIETMAGLDMKEVDEGEGWGDSEEETWPQDDFEGLRLDPKINITNDSSDNFSVKCDNDVNLLDVISKDINQIKEDKFSVMTKLQNSYSDDNGNTSKKDVVGEGSLDSEDEWT